MKIPIRASDLDYVMDMNRGRNFIKDNYFTVDGVKYFNETYPRTVKFLLEGKPNIFSKEETKLINALLDSGDMDNIIIVFQIIDSKPEPI